MKQCIDLKDKKILYELDMNSRQSFGALAKKVELSKNSIISRINKLKKEGIIKNFHAWIDISKLGYMQFRIYLDLRNASPQKEKEIIDFLCKKKIVTWVGEMDGLYNIGAIIATQNIAEMHQLWDELFKKYVNYINARLFTAIAKSNYYYKPYLVNNPKNYLKNSITTASPIQELSETNNKLIRILTEDARTPIIRLSENLKITPKTVIAHIKELEKKKLIVGYSTVLDLDKIGYQTFKVSFLLFRLTPEKMQAFKDYAEEQPNIVYDEEVVGGDDYEVEIQVKDIVELRKIIEDIRLKFNDIIQDYKILHVFKEHKHSGFP
jgi:DNA-binding Lrp family transcriptional regulator